MSHQKIAAVIVAAGRGERARKNGEVYQGPKQYRQIGRSTIIAETIRCFDTHPSVSDVVCVIHKDDEMLYDTATGDLKCANLHQPVFGGATRQASVFEGIKAARKLSCDLVLVHDAVRPFVSEDTITRVIEALSANTAVLAALPVVDTIKRVEKGAVMDTVDRSALWAAQTPQGFHLEALFDALSKADKTTFTDDCAVMEAFGHTVHLVEGNSENVKITTADDIDEANRKTTTMTRLETRVGNGFDVHAFEEGNAVILGGVTIPHTKKLKGHSDADVGLHTLTDAIYGALADGDIGSHFPPSDPEWKGAASDQFLIHACEQVKAREGRIVHLDLTLMCEAPKIGPHREAMREEIARICTLPVSRVAVKATTTEKLGFTGREEGIAAMATATIELPFEE